MSLRRDGGWSQRNYNWKKEGGVYCKIVFPEVIFKPKGRGGIKEDHPSALVMAPWQKIWEELQSVSARG